nr:RNA-directed DNA polymerase, eukaryota, reverse transcriptase zinc-binding domain protein [Tanacetum cinerariifolium]
MNDSNLKFPPGFTPQHSNHYEYEKVEALRESTTPQDSKKVMNDQTFHQVLEESVNKSIGVSKTTHADSMASPVKQRNSLWIKAIKLIHGNSGALDNPYSSLLKNSTWIGILKAINKLKVKGADLMGFCKIVIGNGSTTRFWHDIWYGDICFKEKFKRLFNLVLQKDANVASKLQASNVASSFRRPPRSDGGTFIFLSLMIRLHGIPGSTVYISLVCKEEFWKPRLSLCGGIFESSGT